MLERSAQAPHTWTQEDTEAAVRDFVLEVEPDVVLFQELPRMVPFIETHGMIPSNPVSHSGNLATLVKHELLATEPTYDVVDGCALLTTFGQVTIANVHFEPGPGGTSGRLEQAARVVEASRTADLLIVGDTNTRVDEEHYFADAGLLGEKPPSPTWNSRSNRFRSDAPEFAAYFTRWFATESVDISEVKVWTVPTMSQNKRFCLSDHYAMSGAATLNP